MHMEGYEVRRLCAKDVFPMSRVISKIGVNEFKQAFDPDVIATAVNKLTGQEGKKDDTTATIIGVGVALDMLNIVLGNLGKAEHEIYVFMAGPLQMTPEQVEDLPLDDFTELIYEIFTSPEFGGFMKVVSKLF